MKRFLAISTLLLSSLSYSSAQINADAIDGGIRIYPNTRLLPNARITSDAINTNRPVASFADCGTTDPDTTELKNLPWYGNPQYLEDLLDSVNYVGDCPTCRVEEDVRYRIPVVSEYFVFQTLNPSLL